MTITPRWALCLLLAAGCADHSIDMGPDSGATFGGPSEDHFRPDPRPASERYVPIDIWEDAGIAGFKERWIGGQLQAMGEPILSRPGDLQHFRRRFRMLVLPSFSPAHAIRVDQQADGTGRVRIVRLSGSGGHEPGVVAEQESYTLPAARTDTIFSQVDASGLSSLPPTSPAGADGVSFIFEWVDPAGYRFVDRHQGGLSAAMETLVWQIDGLRRGVESSLDVYRSRRSGRLRPDN